MEWVIADGEHEPDRREERGRWIVDSERFERGGDPMNTDT